MSIRRIAAILGRSPTTVAHYLKSEERMRFK
jgi:AcrR family transcriptional regulator